MPIYTKSVSSRLFISKNSSEIALLTAFAANHNTTVVAHSFLRFYPVSFLLPQSFDVLFFGSPRAVMFFKAQFDIPGSKAIACVGAKTEALLSSMGYTVSFSGDRKGTIHEVAEAFAQWAGDRRVLFPVSSRSIGTIAQRIAENRRETVVCYETKVVSSPVEPCDIYVFTSPSNVEGFFQSNSLPGNARVIAWGKSTEHALLEMHTPGILTLEEPSLDVLQETLQALLK